LGPQGVHITTTVLVSELQVKPDELQPFFHDPLLLAKACPLQAQRFVLKVQQGQDQAVFLQLRGVLSPVPFQAPPFFFGKVFLLPLVFNAAHFPLCGLLGFDLGLQLAPDGSALENPLVNTLRYFIQSVPGPVVKHQSVGGRRFWGAGRGGLFPCGDLATGLLSASDFRRQEEIDVSKA